MHRSTHVIRLRPATLDDLPTLARWDEQPHVIASDPNDDWDWVHELGREVAWREQLIAELDGRPIGFVQMRLRTANTLLQGVDNMRVSVNGRL